MQKQNNRLLNQSWIKEEIRSDIESILNYIAEFWDAARAILIYIQIYSTKCQYWNRRKSQISGVGLHFKKLGEH